MFVDCPYCGFLVALDEDGKPLPRCPNCAQRLREEAAPEAAAPKTPTQATSALPAGVVAARGDTQTATKADIAGSEAAVTAAAELRAASASAPTTAATAAPDARAPADLAPADVAESVATATAPAAPQQGASDVAEPERSPSMRIMEADTAADASSVAADARPAAMADAAQARPEPSASDAQLADAMAAADTRAPAEAGTEQATAPPARQIDAGPEPAAPPDPAHASAATAASAARPAAQDAPLAASSNSIAAAQSPAATPVTAAEPRGDVAADTRDRAQAPARPRGAGPAAALPSFVRAAAPHRDRRRLRLELAAIAALTLLLALQLLLSQRAHLAADARWRPLLSALCGALRCTLPPWREPDAFRVLERDVRAHAPDVLRVSARIRNDARWPQPWPLLRLTLSDADGRAVASRLFRPHEYLGGTPTQSQLGSGQSAALRMDIVEPGPQAVAFTFDFQ